MGGRKENKIKKEGRNNVRKGKEDERRMKEEWIKGESKEIKDAEKSK